ncbi:DMT family transporter [Pseudooceanicola sp. CBS1P-1]|uniref:EamA family transporter n=1 Tax=Pseudooceanicola albus TaxID=2692189 RepID=A0A6L7FYG5_9RHOB|nr:MULTISPECIES: DMT family transporter [Pseudooceanicola]MBT9382242.1 DMT family transporter [Pseudooceanicola endophyticus]MXN16785.1 EamA family transporter [Pseudooceanicola albus]
MSVSLAAPRPASAFLPLILASTFLQGSSFIATQLALASVPPLWLAALRFGVAALPLLPVLLWRGLGLRGLPWRDLWVIGLLQTAGVMAFLTLGLQHTTAPRAAILMASNPLLVALLSAPVLGQRVSPRGWCGLALAGVSICIGPGQLAGGGGLGRGDLLVACGSACWALSTLYGRARAPAVDPWALSFWQMLIGALVLALLALAVREPFALPVGGTGWLAFLWLALPASSGAMSLWFAALRAGGALRASGFLFLCPAFAALIAYAVQGTTLSWHEAGGAVLIAIGVVLLTRRGREGLPEA